MDTTPSPPRPQSAAERLAERRRHVRRIRARIAGLSLVTFLAASGAVLVQLVTGHDPALARDAAATASVHAASSSAAASSGRTSAAASGHTSAASGHTSAASRHTSASSRHTSAATGAVSPSAVTTSAS